jgi:hypothetical protein
MPWGNVTPAPEKKRGSIHIIVHHAAGILLAISSNNNGLPFPQSVATPSIVSLLSHFRLVHQQSSKMAYVQESVDIRETVDREYYAPQYEGRLPPRPWAPRWDDRSERWFYFNERTGETNWNFPESEEFTEFVETDDYYGENEAQDKLRYGGGGAVAGAAAMYEGDRVCM